MKDWTIEDWQRELCAWQRKTFPDSTATSVLAHLRDEVEKELHEDCEPDEIADCIFLLIGLAGKRGIDVAAAMREKFEVNRARTWQTSLNDRGYYSHIEATEPSPP